MANSRRAAVLLAEVSRVNCYACCVLASQTGLQCTAKQPAGAGGGGTRQLASQLAVVSLIQ
jgi:hypothetical protein